MLKRFLLNMLSSFVGAWLAIILLIVAGFMLVVSIVGNIALSNVASEQVKSRSVLKLTLDGEIIEKETATAPDFAKMIQGQLDKPQTLNVLVEAIKEAARNKNIAALYLECGSVSAPLATLDALREEVVEFKKSGKPVYAYGENMGTGAYFVASGADRIYMNPQGSVAMQGMSSTSMFMKDLFDKLGVQFQVVKVGTYKSAVEPYIMQQMSEPARAQMDTLMTNMWSYITKCISSSRKGLTPAKIDTLISAQSIAFAPSSLSVTSGLVDSLVYGRQMSQRFGWITGQEGTEVNFVSPAALVTQVPWSDSYSSKNQIAVLYATGEIADGNPKAIDYETLVPIIVDLADNERIKGMVLRVNSPGGSAYGSDQIGEALDYFQSKGKPLAVSMGDYAASGGYWISACGDIIFADPLTITGSIGIFGLIPNFKGLTDKIGINFETVSTNPGANFPTGYRPMDERQMSVMQDYVNRGYDEFVGRVAKGRRMSVEAVKRIAEGRVWDAISAKRIGLVDSLGNLQKAIEWTARKADVFNKYDIAAYPQYQPSFWDMVPTEAMAKAGMIPAAEQEKIIAEYAKLVLSRHKVQAKMPEVKIEFAN